MSVGTTKLEERARKGLRQLERGLQKLPNEASVEMAADTLQADEVVVLVVTRNRTIVRRKIIGRLLTSREIRLRLAGAEAAIDDLARAQDPNQAPQLTAPEAALLDGAGFGPGESVPSALERSRIELELLIRTSFTIDAAAKALGVTTSRIRQRLSSERTLFGLKEGRSWRIPRFQFAGKGRLVRNIEVVLPHIRVDAAPLAVKRWLTLPHQDLVTGEEDQRVSPIAWLVSGGSPDVVAELATEV